MSAPFSANAGATLVLWWATGGALAQVRRPGPIPFEALITVAAAAAAWCIVAWLTMTLLLAVVAELTDRTSHASRLAYRFSPRGVRRCAALLLGIALLPGTASAYADDRPADVDDPYVASIGLADASFSFDRPASRARASAQQAIGEVVVVRGDTLWGLVRDYLGPTASAADVATEWPRWHDANHHTIGSDPDLIRPGQRLSPPPTARAERARAAHNSTPSTEEIP